MPAPSNRNSLITRRDFLSRAGMAGLAVSAAGASAFGSRGTRDRALAMAKVRSGGTVDVDATSVERFLLSCQKPNGAFGPADQEYTDLAWNYPAVHSLHLLGVRIPRSAECLEHGSRPSPRMRTAGVYQKAMLNHLLGAGPEIDTERPWSLRGAEEPSFRMEDGEAVYSDMESLWQVVTAITTAGGRIANVNEVSRVVRGLQASDGSVHDHLIEASLAVLAFERLGIAMPRADACVRWLRSCQEPDGGFRRHPEDPARSNHADVWYTWAAVDALRALGSGPEHPERAVRWINSLQNADGGFGDRPGWRSRLESTYHALAALTVLTGDARRGIEAKRIPARRASRFNPLGYSFFHAHHKSPPGGPDMIETVRRMGYHLIGVKAQDFDVDALRAYVREQGYAMEVLANPEVYEHEYRIRGRIVDHVSNFMVPPDMSPDQHATFTAAVEAGTKGYDWPEFARTVIRPLLDLGTLFYPEWDHERVNAYRVYDDGLDGGAGYNSIHAAHRNGPDRIRLYPYRERWLEHHPFLADGDAHRPIETPRETNNMLNFRNIYLARDHRLPEYLDASLNQRSVCVIRDPELPSGICYYGHPDAVDYLKRHRNQWQWWQG